ncbi:MAG: hypothetical protein ACP5I8_15105 [Phycisphaerae bacterium]
MNFERWLITIYKEEDFARSISTALSGAAGLAVYLWLRDWTVALFALIIVFPLFRLMASAFHVRWGETHRIRAIFDTLSVEEKEVVKAFADAGGAVLSCGQLNRANLTSAGVESLVIRGFLQQTMLSGCDTEAMAMNLDLFDLGRQIFPRSQAAHANGSPAGSDGVPF